MRANRAARAVTCIALASALCVPALAAQSDYYLKIDGVEGESTADRHKGEIEILSYSWGASQAAAGYELEPARVTSWSTSGHGDSAAGGGGTNEMRMNDTAGSRAAAASDGEAEITLKGQAPEAKKRPGRVKYGDITLKRGVAGASEAKPAGVSAPAQTAREHDKRTVWVARSAPAQAGAVRVKVKMPWRACRVGARYPTLELGGGGKAYVLHDATVASCGPSGDADDRPTEEVAFNYAKVEVRGWDPKKKAE